MPDLADEPGACMPPFRAPAASTGTLPRDVSVDPDNVAEVFALLLAARNARTRGALVTLSQVVGGAPRGLGSHMAVLEDGRFCGRLSGGCLEVAVAAEALLAIRAQKPRRVRFGAGSPYFDIQLPCGGGIDIDIDPHFPGDLLEDVSARLASRQPFSITFPASGERPRIGMSTQHAQSETTEAGLVRHYHPATRLLIVGEGYELSALARLAAASGLEVHALPANGGACANRASTPATVHASMSAAPVDPFTAIVVLQHDPPKELPVLQWALALRLPFYIGALGSRRTHHRRLAALRASGVPRSLLARIRGPIGLFGPARTAASLAISILAEISQARSQLDGAQ